MVALFLSAPGVVVGVRDGIALALASGPAALEQAVGGELPGATATQVENCLLSLLADPVVSTWCLVSGRMATFVLLCAPGATASDGGHRTGSLLLTAAPCCSPLLLLTAAVAHYCYCSLLLLLTAAIAHRCCCSPLLLLLLLFLTVDAEPSRWQDRRTAAAVRVLRVSRPSKADDE